MPILFVKDFFHTLIFKTILIILVGTSSYPQKLQLYKLSHFTTHSFMFQSIHLAKNMALTFPNISESLFLHGIQYFSYLFKEKLHYYWFQAIPKWYIIKLFFYILIWKSQSIFIYKIDVVSSQIMIYFFSYHFPALSNTLFHLG